MRRFDVHVERWNEDALDAGETYERESEEGLTLHEALRVMRSASSSESELYAHRYGISLESGDRFTGDRVSATLSWPPNTTKASRQRLIKWANNGVF